MPCGGWGIGLDNLWGYMSTTRLSDQEFAAAWHRAGGSPIEVSRLTGLTIRNVYARRTTVESNLGTPLPTITIDGRTGPRTSPHVDTIGYRRKIEIINGEVIIGSDGHFWPGERSVAFDAFINLVKRRLPKLVVLNGDALDGSSISRHSPGGWANLPDLADELAAVQERMGEIEVAAGPDIPLILCAGNHDSRFSSRLAQHAPEFIRVHGTDLADHLPNWQFCWSLWINDDVIVKHRYHGGIHAGYNNVLKSGKSIVTGHTHRLGVRWYYDYNEIPRCSVETGTLMEISPESDKLTWTEDNPIDWHPGFVLLTFANGLLIDAECCRIIDGRAIFRGEQVI